MKKLLVILFLSICLMFLGIGISSADPVDITIPDLSSSGTGWYGMQEDNETEPGTLQSQDWDLEAFKLDYDTNDLWMIGGFDFANGVEGYSAFSSGDVFIDTTGDALYGDGSYDDALGADGSGHNNSVKNGFGYDYAIDLTFNNDATTGGTYSVWAINEDTMVDTSFYGINEGSNPWQLSTVLADRDNPYLTGAFNYGMDNSLPYDGDTHYYVTLLGLGDNLTAAGTIYHFTMGCGNDNLMGRVSEPATLLLLGTGFIGLAVVGRKRFL